MIDPEDVNVGATGNTNLSQSGGNLNTLAQADTNVATNLLVSTVLDALNLANVSELNLAGGFMGGVEFEINNQVFNGDEDFVAATDQEFNISGDLNITGGTHVDSVTGISTDETDADGGDPDINQDINVGGNLSMDTIGAGSTRIIHNVAGAAGSQNLAVAGTTSLNVKAGASSGNSISSAGSGGTTAVFKDDVTLNVENTGTGVNSISTTGAGTSLTFEKT